MMSTSRRIHSNCLQPHVNLPEYSGSFTGNFTNGTITCEFNLEPLYLERCLTVPFWRKRFKN